MKTFRDFGIEIDEGSGDENVRTTCPQCSPGRHKSYEKCLSVNVRQGVWYCHHCGWTGGLGEEASNHEKAAKVFAKPHFVESEVTDPKVISWFAGRGISVRTLSAFHVKSGQAWMYGANGSDGMVNTIQFPYYHHGQVVNIKYRTGDKRFRQEKNARKCFYNYDMALNTPAEKLIITEGEMDCLALYESGFSAVVSVPDGAPSPNTKTYASKFDFLTGSEELFEKFKFVIIAGDNDAPGEKLKSELSRRIGLDKCLQVFWPSGCKDANDVLRLHGVDALRRCINEAAFFPVDGVKTVSDLWMSVASLHEQPEQPGFEIGWDNAIGKFNVELGQMTIVTGIPSHGKSTFIDALRVNLFKFHGVRSAVFSPENWPAQTHMANLVQMYRGTNFYEMDESLMFSTMEEMIDGFYFIMPEKDEDMMDIDTILEKTKHLVFRHGVQVLVIDPWNEVEHHIPNGMREDQYISQKLAKIRRFARVNGIHIFVIAHPRQLEKNKDGDYPPPTAYDIAGGAMWRNKADNILCVHRPDLSTSETLVQIQKIRFKRNGKAGTTLKFVFHVDTSTYHDRGILD